MEHSGVNHPKSACLSHAEGDISVLSGEISQSIAHKTVTHLTDGNVQATDSEKTRADGDAQTEDISAVGKEESADLACESGSTETPAEETNTEAHGQNSDTQDSSIPIGDADVTDKVESAEETDEENAESADTPIAPQAPHTVDPELEELIAHFPILRRAKSLEDIPEYARYKEFRTMGLDIPEAFCASNAALFADEQARRRATEIKSHLHPLVSTSTAARPLLSESQRRFARATLGGDISDEELDRLWCKITPTQNPN